MRALDTIVLIAVGIFAVKYVLPLFAEARAYAVAPEINTMKVPTTSKGTKGGGAQSTGMSAYSHPTWGCVTHRDRLKVLKDPATVTGVVLPVSGGPHNPSDGDLVFSLKLDPPYANMVNKQNDLPHYGGGLWIEAVCQKANKAESIPRHKGDCASGCGAIKFPVPKVGDHLKLTGAWVQDVGEENHLELHPLYTMQQI